MKKLFALTIALLAVFTLAACNGSDNGDDTLPELVYPDLQAAEYEGRDFVTDGIGVATLASCVDGDTTRFNTAGGQVTIRYLGVDTPESTGIVEEWGKKASEFVCDVLTNAETIVLEADMNPQVGRLDNHGRHLGYIWYDGKLLNLELIELGYSPAQGTGLLKYGDQMFLAQRHAREQQLRLWDPAGDPTFNAEPLEATVEALLDNTDDYFEGFVNVEGTVRNVNGANFDLEGEDGRTIFVYGHHQISSKIENGHVVRLEGVYLTYWSGRLQLTNFNPRNTEVLDTP